MILETYTGKYLDYAAPSADQIDVEDIAHSLSLISRFIGHTVRFYSVAEHALLTLALAPADLPSAQALAVLHHDSHEAYLGDIPTPLKSHLVGLEGLKTSLDHAVADAFGFDVAALTRPSVKAADRLALRIEANDLKPSRGLGAYWGNYEPPVTKPPWRLGLEPAVAKHRFLDVHRRLVEGR